MSPASAHTELLTDASYRTACGPIACYTALRSVGDDASLADVATRCQWREGEYTTLGRMAGVVADAAGVRCSPVRLSPLQLNEFLAKGEHAAILLIRKFGPEVDHAVCAVHGDGDFILTVDYPQLGQWRHRDELAEVWDGEALIVWREASGRPLLWCMALLPGACLGALALMWRAVRGRRPQRRGAAWTPGTRGKENEKP